MAGFPPSLCTLFDRIPSMTYPGKKMAKGEGWVGNSAPRRVFILGAGFSKAVSDLMPDTNELGRLIAEKLEIPSNLTRGTFEDWLSRLGEVQPDVLPADNFQRQNYFRQIVETIGISLEEKQNEVLGQEGGLPSWLFRFVATMHFWQSTLISFNYDNLVELAAAFATIKAPPIPGIPSQTTISAGDIVGQKPPLPTGPSRTPHPTFRLWKLHGSLAWWWVPSDSTGMTIARWALDSEELLSSTKTEKIDNTFGSRASLYRSEPDEDEINRRGRFLYGRSRYLAPSSGLKSNYYQNPFMTKLWQDSRNALENATEVYFVGYSMPPADTAPRGLFRESIPSNASIFVVNRRPESISEQLKAWGFDRVESINGEECIKTMVEKIERQRVNEVVDRLKADLSSGQVIKSNDDQSRVLWLAKQPSYGLLELSGIEGRSLVLKPQISQAEGSPENSGQQSKGEIQGNLTGSKLTELLRENDFEEIVVSFDDRLQRVISYELKKDQIFDDRFTLRQLWLHVPNLST